MSSQHEPKSNSNDPRVRVAFQEYLNRLTQVGSVDLEAFISRHAEIAAELRTVILRDQQRRRQAGEPKHRPDVAIAETLAAEVAPHSILGEVENTVFERPDSHGPSSTGSSIGDMPVVFGRYRVEKKLGSGAMGAVYLAHDTILRRNVALKTPKFDVDRDGELIKRFYREASAVANLKHPHLCGVYDVGAILGRHFISMEFIRGKKLQDFIKPDKVIAEKQVMAVVRKVALAMHEAHVHGVVHRDLKPDNIMVNERGEPVVMDFGLVHQIESEESTRITQQGMLIGSPAYMSKEQVEGDLSKLTAATDQYSLGVILYQLLTSRLPFDGSLHSVLGAILSQEPIPPSHYRPDLNPHLQAVCLKMMSKEPHDRYPSMKAAAEAILDVSRGVSQAAGNVAIGSMTADGATVEGLTETFSDTTQQQGLGGFNFSDFAAKEKLRRARRKRSRVMRYSLLVVGVMAFAAAGYWFRNHAEPVKIVATPPARTVSPPSPIASRQPTPKLQPNSGSVDVLKRINTGRDAISGAWILAGGVLISPKERNAAIVLPVDIAVEEYQLVVDAERVSGTNNLSLFLVVDGEEVQVCLDSDAKGGTCSALNVLDGKPIDQNETTWRGTVLPNGKSTRLICTVRNGLIRVEHDGQTIIDWKGSPNKLTHDPNWTAPLPKDKLSLGSWDSVFKITRISLHPCPPADAIAFQGKMYKLFQETLSWHDAQKRCRDMGGRLVEVRSYNENNFVSKLALESGASGIWLGATDEAVQARWLWENGSGLAYNNFAVGEPRREIAGKRYLMMMLRKDVLGKWCNQPSTPSEWFPFFVCEWDAIANDNPVQITASPDPSTSPSVDSVGAIAQPSATGLSLGGISHQLPELVPLTDTANTTSSQASAWVSQDGLRMYWEQLDHPEGEYEIWQAARSSYLEPFRNQRVVGKGRQPTLSPDELQMVFIQLDERPAKRLYSATRASITDPFGPATELAQFDDRLGFNNPFISADGLALFVTGRSEPSVLTARSYVARRPRLSAPWSQLQPLDIRWDAVAQQAPLTWLAMAPDELSFLATHELDVGLFRVVKFTRKDSTQPFETFEYLSVPAFGPVHGRSPRYIPATKELFLTAPVDYSKATTLAGWQDEHRPVLWVIRNVELSSPKIPNVAASAPSTPSESPSISQMDTQSKPQASQDSQANVTADWVDLLEWSEGIDWKPHGYDWNENCEGTPGKAGITLKRTKLNRFPLPAFIDGEYDMEVEFVRHEGDEGVTVFFPVGPHNMHLELGMQSGSVAGVHFVDEKSGLVGNPTTRRPSPISNGQKHRVVIRVRRSGQQASFNIDWDDQLNYISWSGDQSRLKVQHPGYWDITTIHRPWIGSFENRITFEKVRVRMVSGSIRKTFLAQSDREADLENGFVRLVGEPAIKPVVGWGRFCVNQVLLEDIPELIWPLISREFVPCRDFYGAHAPSRLKCPIPSGSKSFTVVGYNDSSRTTKYIVFVDGKEVYASTVTGIVPIRIDLPRGAGLLELIVETGGDDARNDSSYWCYPRYHDVSAANVTERMLDARPRNLKFEIQSHTVGFDKLTYNQPMSGFKSIPVDFRDATPCDEFLYSVPNASVTYAIPEGMTRFTAIGYCVVSHSARFEVWADAKQIFQREAGIALIDVKLPEDTKTIELKVSDLGKNHGDHAMWCYPRLHRK